MTARGAIVACALAALLLPGVTSAGGGAGAAVASDVCDLALHDNGWCAACGHGFVAGIAIPSKTVWEALDAHGHPLRSGSLGCTTCEAALASVGYCEEHRRGFVDGQAYYSRLAYWLAQGRDADAAERACRNCSPHAEPANWCDEHGRGHVGNIVFENREAYDHAAAALSSVLRSLMLLESCELCAAAMAIDGRCPEHKRSFDRGVERTDS